MTRQPTGRQDRMVRRGLWLAPFDEPTNPHVLASLAAAAEEQGWDGFFVWDHVQHSCLL
jgi:hypothetical protein